MIALMDGNPTLDNLGHSDYCKLPQEQLAQIAKKWLIESVSLEELTYFERLAVFNMLVATAYNHLDEYGAEVNDIIWYDKPEDEVKGIVDQYIADLTKAAAEIL